ncbi:hypothetical protein BJY01DRAFT_100716 [Aspergillus pseudoustus]|uniref:Zn(2)-C6 fungal-type domain-containing protein n=1 Tax=Aspergillus pseudoustus TaxID=1810923 RepID=A0ABR4KII8_9EURO
MDRPRSSQPPKTRSACDRCHSQKLRCSRQSGQSRCERCERLDTACRFAARTRRGSKKPRPQQESSLVSRPQISSNQSPTPVTSFESATDPGWPTTGDSWLDSLGLSGAANELHNLEGSACGEIDVAWPLMSPKVDDPASYLGLQMTPILAPTLTSTTPTHELANLSIALYELYIKLPSATYEIPDSELNAVQSRRGHSRPFVFDDLFGLTTRFTDLIKRSLLSTDGQDEPLTLMVGSCHSRLMGIYTAIFSMIHLCIRHSRGPPRPRPDGAIILPNVQLGSLNCPPLRLDFETPMPVEKVLMYISMVAVFSAQLWGQMAELVRERYLGHGRNSVAGAMWKEMGERMDGLLDTIDNTKGLLF